MSIALGVPRVVDVLSKVIQECQNGLLGRVFVIPAPAVPPSAGWLSRVRSDVLGYCESTAARVYARPTGMDIVLPQAIATVEMTDLGIVVAGHRRGELAPWAHGQMPAGREILPEADGGVPAEDPGCEDLQALAAWVASVDVASADDAIRERVLGLLKHESWLVSSLSCDALNAAGYPAVPQFVIDHAPLNPPGEPGTARSRSFTEVFEARISVDEYALYEATHPGYALQTVVIGQAIRRFRDGDPDRILDVGSGPGLPTVMLAELFPKSHIDAVEPSEAAFPYLCRNSVGYRINPHNIGIADFEPPDRYPVIVSVGSSHHLDTRIFLRSLVRLADDGGLVIVADEMISRFLLEQDRTQNIIDHHMAYIDAALGNISPDDLPEPERRRLIALRTSPRDSSEALHDLLDRVRADRVDLGTADGPWQRVRFAVLELEALVAGIDYDVERKTYAANFLRMAEGEGLELITHRRLYGTQGSAPEDAGTHFFAFRRPPSARA
jgi:SAM-dependent methyltransferase